MLRIAFYYNHYNTLGHSTRLYALAKGIKEYYKDKVEIVILQSGKKQDNIPFFKLGKVFFVPYAVDKRAFFIEEQVSFYNKLIGDGKLDKMLKARVDFMVKVLADFQPQIFITEYFPFGREFWSFELPHILGFIKKHFSCKICSSTGYLNYTQNMYEHIKNYYDLLLVHSPQEISSDYRFYVHQQAVEVLNKVTSDFASKIHFTGFIVDAVTKCPSVKARGFKYKILVSRGGGIVNRKIILASLLAAKRMKGYLFYICCGPATPEKEWNEYVKLAKGCKNIRLLRSLSQAEFDRYLIGSDLSINMAGYNTTVRLLSYRKKTILVPYRTSEQAWRAEFVSRYLPSRILQENRLSANKIRDSILSLLEENSRPVEIDNSWFNGVKRSVEIIRDYLA